MASDLTYKLSNWQVSPPPGLWKQLRARLDEEYDVHETNLAMKLDDAAITPPSSVWENINAELQGTPVNRRARLIAIPYRRFAVAAAFIGMIGFAAWYFLMFGNSDADGPSVTASVSTSVAPKKTNQKPPEVKTTDRKVVTPFHPSSTIVLNSVNIPVLRPVPVRRIPSPKKPASTNRLTAYSIAPVLPDRPIVIEAPPIRDEQGNIVMNTQLLKSGGDDRYIVVTSPNGQQTRISDKFLNVLQYLHAQDEDYIGPDIYQRHVWKQRILEWKNKLIHSAGFIPSNNNFLGIMDLKELVQQD